MGSIQSENAKWHPVSDRRGVFNLQVEEINGFTIDS
jgi:hypothetical protein